MNTLKVKTVKGSIDADGRVTLTLTHLDDTQKNVKLGKIRFAQISGKKIDQNLSDVEKLVVQKQIERSSKKYLKDNNIVSQDMIPQQAEAFLESIRNGTRKPDFIGYFQ
ncbi:TPA: hypothetical protein DIC40_06310 [Patescibacteria group bacterium]|nr:hypothetical protein P148_SR1C00001G0096 [candidate division SR1 bacterium RAAC1_SR1_1]HCY21420.1 hypothetical protein [Candidatus Gracilibacteria bacterium]